MTSKNRAWKIPTRDEEQTTVSLQDVMSEEMALRLQQEETSKVSSQVQNEEEMNRLLNSTFDQQADPDFILAKLLQLEFDREFEEISKQTPESSAALNSNSPTSDQGESIAIALESSATAQNDTLHDDDNDDDDTAEDEEESCDDDYEDDDREWDMFEKTEKVVPLGKVGYVIENDGRIRTKHDLNHSQRLNACRVMTMNLSTGDGGGFDMKLNNNVYNSLKTHVRKERRRRARVNEKDEKSTAEGVMDEQSRLQIFKLVNMGILDECNGIVSTGKESNVYHGIGGNVDKKINVGEVAIKVFKTTLTEFKNRSMYIRGDHRFNDRLSKQNTYKIIDLWAEKEMHNLNRIKRSGILCPEVVMLRKHILVMSFLGKNGIPAPTLREAIHLTDTQLNTAMEETIDIMKRMYEKCDLVHGDLSEYNLLYHMGHVYVIDLGQSVLRGHPNALRFLLRDCNNISRFFGSRGVLEIPSGPELFCLITGHQIEMSENLDEVDVLKKILSLEKESRILAKHHEDSNEDLFEQMLLKSELDRKNQASTS